MGNEPMRCGVIGVGRMGRHHARVYAQLDGVELVGVVDRDPDRRAAITEEWGGTGFETAAELLDAGVDAVTIATPTIYHREAAEIMLEAGVLPWSRSHRRRRMRRGAGRTLRTNRCDTPVGHVVVSIR